MNWDKTSSYLFKNSVWIPRWQIVALMAVLMLQSVPSFAQVSFDRILGEPQLPALSLTQWNKIDWRGSTKSWEQLLTGVNLEQIQAQRFQEVIDTQAGFQHPHDIVVEPEMDVEQFCSSVKNAFLRRAELLDVLAEKVQVLGRLSRTKSASNEFEALAGDIAQLSREIESVFPASYSQRNYELQYWWRLQPPASAPELALYSGVGSSLAKDSSIGISKRTSASSRKSSLAMIESIDVQYLSLNGWEWSDLRRETYPDLYDFQQPMAMGQLLLMARHISAADLCLNGQQLQFRAKVQWRYTSYHLPTPAVCALEPLLMESRTVEIPSYQGSFGTPLQITLRMPDFGAMAKSNLKCTAGSVTSQTSWLGESDFAGETTNVSATIDM